MDADEVWLEISRIAREAEKKVREKMAREQLAEAWDISKTLEVRQAFLSRLHADAVAGSSAAIRCVEMIEDGRAFLDIGDAEEDYRVLILPLSSLMEPRS